MPDGMNIMSPANILSESYIALTAFEIRGDIYDPVYCDGDAVFVSREPDPVWQNHVGWDCLVKLVGKPEPLIHTVMLGSGGTCDLQFVYNEARHFDAEVEWVKRIQWVKRRRADFSRPVDIDTNSGALAPSDIPAVRTLLDIVRPIADRWADSSSSWGSERAPEYYRRVHRALAEVIGPRSVAAVYPIWRAVQDAYAAGEGEHCEDVISAVDGVLDMFIAVGQPSSPDCVAARAAYISELSRRSEGLNTITAELACDRTPIDVGVLRGGEFRGELFSGSPRWIDFVLAAVRERDAE